MPEEAQVSIAIRYEMPRAERQHIYHILIRRHAIISGEKKINNTLLLN